MILGDFLSVRDFDWKEKHPEPARTYIYIICQNIRENTKNPKKSRKIPENPRKIPEKSQISGIPNLGSQKTKSFTLSIPEIWDPKFGIPDFWDPRKSHKTQF